MCVDGEMGQVLQGGVDGDSTVSRSNQTPAAQAAASWHHAGNSKQGNAQPAAPRRQQRASKARRTHGAPLAAGRGPSPGSPGSHRRLLAVHVPKPCLVDVIRRHCTPNKEQQ